MDVLSESCNDNGYTIGNRAFAEYSEIHSIYIPAKVEGIEENAFIGCDVTKVFWFTNTPPAGYEHLCGKINYVSNDLYTELKNTVVTPFLSSRFEVDGVCFVPTSVVDRKCCVVDYNPSVSEVNVTVVDTVNYKAKLMFEVNDVMPYAFYKNENIATLALQNKGKIGASAFEGCASLEKVNIPVSVTSVEDYAFKGCSKLKEAKFVDRETLLPLGKQLFADCPLNSLYLGAKISYISEASRDNSPFCNNTSLKTVVITNVESDVYDYEFYGCSGLESAEVGDGVERIGRWAFSGCSSLKDFVFGSNVTSIGEEAFSDCINMTNITSRAILPPVCGAQALDDINKMECTLTVPNKNLTSYQSAEQWKEFPFIENMVTEDHYVTYMIDNKVYKTLLLTPGERIIAPYVSDKDGKYFGGWDMEKYMQTVTITSSDVVSTTKKTSIDLASNADAMLYTNAKCTNTQWGDQFVGWHVLFDNNPATFFHSEYNDVDSEDGQDHYLRIDMGEGKSVSEFTFTYTVRGTIPTSANYSPKKMVVEGSNTANGEYTEIATLTDLPNTAAAVYESATLSNGNAYRYIRFRVTETFQNSKKKGHSYFFMAEFGMSKIERESTTVTGPTETITMPIMPDEDITIYGKYVANTHTITYMVDGVVYDTVEAESGSTIDLIDAPTKEGHTFSGWSEVPATMPDEDITITGTFVVNSYTITYLVDGEEYKKETVAYGSAITLIDAPSKEGHTFSGWSEVPATMPANDITIEGTFAVNSYTITYLVDGEEYKKETVSYGSAITLLDVPAGVVWDNAENIPSTMPAHDIVIKGRSESSSVESVEAEKEKVVYDLQGNRIIDTENLEKGIYIVNGKKVLVK